MSCSQRVALLDERLRLLTGGRRTAVERHQTLRATVDWSYSLLSPTERTVFDRLAVFSGGFTMAAATAVVAGEGVEYWDVVDALGSLVGKSMVVATAEPAGVTRYQLLETMRQYARERLDAESDSDRWRRQHARYFASLAVEIGDGLQGRDEAAWRERLMADLDNLRGALVWGLDSEMHDDQQLAVAIAAHLAIDASNAMTATGRWAEQALDAARNATSGMRSAVLGAAATAAHLRGDLSTADVRARASLAEGFPLEDPNPVQASIVLASVLMFAGKRDEAAACFDRADRAITARGGSSFWLSVVESSRIQVGLFAEDEDAEIAHARHGMSAAERTGNPTSLALASYALGWALRHRRPAEAITALDRAVDLMRREAMASLVGFPLAFSARAVASQGDSDGAKSRLREALALSSKAAEWLTVTGCLDVGVDVFAYLDEPEVAAALAGAVEHVFAELRFPYVATAGPGLAVREANLAKARATLGDAAYEAAYARGAAMTREHVIALTLDHLRTPRMGGVATVDGSGSPALDL